MKVGDKVRVLAIPDWLVHDLPQEDVDNLRAQIGVVHEIHDVQPGDYLWLSGWFALKPSDVELVQSGAMTSGPCYRQTDIPIKAGDLVLWFDDDQPSRVLFVLSTGDCVPEEVGKIDWYASEFGNGVMLDTPGAGWVLESENSPNIRPLAAGAQCA